MPKKFTGENSKAVAAKARKAGKAEEEKLQQERAKEDAYWRDDEPDKNLAKKQARKDEAERKRLEAVQRKKERDELEANESKTLPGKSGGGASGGAASGKPTKVTQAQIRLHQQEQQQKAAKSEEADKAPKSHLEAPLEENLNRLVDPSVKTATNLDEAIAVLSLKDQEEIDRHPEKRMKASYEAFEKDRLPQLKAENSNLRLSQLKQMLRKEWMKSPSNPLNQQLTSNN